MPKSIMDKLKIQNKTTGVAFLFRVVANVTLMHAEAGNQNKRQKSRYTRIFGMKSKEIDF